MTDKILSFPSSPEGSGPEGVDPPKFKLPEAISTALELTCGRVLNASAIMEVVASSIAKEYDCERIGSVNFPRALKMALAELEAAACRLDSVWLERYAEHDPAVREEIKRVAELRESAE